MNHKEKSSYKKRKTNSTFDEILEIDKKNSFLAQIEITLLIDDLFWLSRFDEVDNFLKNYKCEETSIDLLVSTTSSASAGRSHLKEFESFVKRANEKVFSKRGYIFDLEKMCGKIFLKI